MGCSGVHPVNFTMLGKAIIFRTGAGATLYALAKQRGGLPRRPPRPRPAGRWSVIATGSAEEITISANPGAPSEVTSGP